MVSWIHIEDYCRAVQHIIDTRYLEGAINVTGPNPVNNKEFMREIRAMVRPLFHINQPKWLLEFGAVLMRTETELLLKSRYVIPERLEKSGFEFRYKTISDLRQSNSARASKSMELFSQLGQ